MSTYKVTQLHSFQFNPRVRLDLPFAIDDFTLAMHLGIRCKTLWWLIWGLNEGTLVRRIEIPKPSGGIRVVYNVHPRVKAVQKAIVQKFLDPLPLEDHVGAYRKGLNYVNTSQKHVGKGTVFQYDVKQFFDQHRRALVRRFFVELGYARQVASLLGNLLTVRQKVKVGPFITGQGLPSSPAICNHLANEYFDKPLLAALPKEFEYTRYSDNIFISHASRLGKEECLEVHNLVYQTASRAGYQLHDEEDSITFSDHLEWSVEALPLNQILPNFTTLLSQEVLDRGKDLVTAREEAHTPLLSVFKSRGKYRAKNDEISVLGYLKSILTDDTPAINCRVGKGRAQIILGLVTNEKVAVPRVAYKALQSIIHNCYTKGFESQVERCGKGSVGQLMAFLRGKITWVKTVNEIQGQKLENMMVHALAAEESRATSAALATPATPTEVVEEDLFSIPVDLERAILADT